MMERIEPAFWILCGLLLIYEAVAAFFPARFPGQMISEIVWRVTRFHPLVPFALGFLMGHFFWSRR